MTFICHVEKISMNTYTFDFAAVCSPPVLKYIHISLIENLGGAKSVCAWSLLRKHTKYISSTLY